ncbi:hypothetical protein ACS0TY_018457 [Phlomoides rotata]
MVKFLKPNKVVVVLQGRYAGCKAVIIATILTAIAWLLEGEFQTQTLEIDGKEVKAQIWDTIGQERFRTVTSTYYRGAFSALVVYDITRRSTFGSIPQWLDELKTQDGKLRVFKWPSMEIILNEAPHSSVKDLNFSLDGKFLVSVGNGTGKMTAYYTSSILSSKFLLLIPGEILGYCWFSQTTGNDQVLYVTSMRGKDSRIVKFNTSWQRISTTCITRESVCAFNVSPDGKLLAIGTAEGYIIINSSTNLWVHTYVKKAHLGFVTASAFSLDSRALFSTSMDSSSRVTLIKDKKKDGMNLWIILLIIILAVSVYYAKTKELIPL